MTINFDRDSVGISAKKDWHDSETLANIGIDIRRYSAWSIGPLPKFDTGRTTLKEKTTHFLNRIGTVLFEFSDAAAVLGSGQESAIGNFAATEYENIERFGHLRNWPEMVS